MPIYESSADTVYTSDSGATKGKHLFGDGATAVLSVDEANAKVGVNVNAPSKHLGLGGTADRTFGVERQTTAATAGAKLTVGAGDAKLAGTDLAGGDLVLASGVSTGSADSGVEIQVPTAGSTGTSDNAVAKIARFASGLFNLVGDFLFSGAAARYLKIDRRPDAGAGRALTVGAGPAKAGETNTAGGDLVLQAGIGTGTGGSGNVEIKTAPAGSTGTTDNTLATALKAWANGDVTAGTGDLAQGATKGFMMIPQVAAAPNGAPTDHVGFVPIVFCEADNKIYIYNFSGTPGWKASSALT